MARTSALSVKVNSSYKVSPVHRGRYSTNWDRKVDPARKFKYTLVARVPTRKRQPSMSIFGTVQTESGKVDPARKFKCTTAARDGDHLAYRPVLLFIVCICNVQLVSGVSNLLSGVGNLVSGVGNLVSGVSNLVLRVSNLVLGVSNLVSGVANFPNVLNF